MVSYRTSQNNVKNLDVKSVVMLTETDTFSSTVTGEVFQINHKLSCEEKCLIYLLKGKVCKKQYVGETMDAFRLK